MASVTLVGGVEVSKSSAVPEPRFANWIPEYWVMVLNSGVVPNWLRKACSAWAYTKSGEAALLKPGPQKRKTTLAEVITGPPWFTRFWPALGAMAPRTGK